MSAFFFCCCFAFCCADVLRCTAALPFAVVSHLWPLPKRYESEDDGLQRDATYRARPAEFGPPAAYPWRGGAQRAARQQFKGASEEGALASFRGGGGSGGWSMPRLEAPDAPPAPLAHHAQSVVVALVHCNPFAAHASRQQRHSTFWSAHRGEVTW